jgi:intein-encoded DNA endonuclease-like protein
MDARRICLLDDLRIRKDFSFTPQLAYVIGAVLGDGDIKHAKTGDYIVRVRTVDSSFAEKYYKLAKESGLNPWWCKPEKCEGRFGKNPLYCIHVSSKKLFTLIARLRENPKLLVDLLENERFICNFLAGFYDAEGSMRLTKRKRGIVKDAVMFCNTNLELQNVVLFLLKRLGFKAKIIARNFGENRRLVYYVTFYGIEDTERFEKSILGLA